MIEPIAITAASGVFPGANGPETIDEFWRSVKAARRARLDSLEKKWGLRRSDYFDPAPGTPYRTYLDRAFTISDSLGSQIDWGVRVLKDLLHSVRGQMPAPSRTGLCLATSWTDSSYFHADTSRVVGGASAVEGQVYAPDAQLQAIADAGGIEGPALAVDNACASSLYALDTAIGMLFSGQADAVVVLGLNVFLPAFLYLGFSKLTALSPTGEILPFSADASGIVPAEAAAAILVEPLGQAQASGRPMLAVIRGLGLSADGGERSIFAPGPIGQRLAYERAYREISPADIHYVEAHGTATVLGDQTEIEALDAFFKPHRRNARLPIGSVKALVGHSLACAGLVSIVKALCMLRDGVIPPHIPVQPNPRLADSCLRLPEEIEPWPEDEPVRRVGVSSFGFGGANAHLVLESNAAYAAGGAKRSIGFSPVAILAADAVLGEAQGIRSLTEKLSSQEPKLQPFPLQRFSESALQDGVYGSYFPPQLTVEGHGVRMGPKPLSRLDPFQRLGIHLVQGVLQDAADTRPEETGLVFCTNLGGEMSLQLTRHYVAHFAGQNDKSKRYAQVEPSLEAIASGLPSLCSGFPAFCLGIKGFHQTVSGGAMSFWQALALSPYWLNGRCSAFLLAAGRHIKSPLDLDRASTPQGEGSAVFLLRSLDSLPADDEPLAVIHSVAFGADLDEVCASTNISAAGIDLIEISQIDPEVEVGGLGKAQSNCGFLGEATGIEALLRLLLIPGTGWRAVQIQRGTETVGSVLLEKLREVPCAERAIVTPLPVIFQPAAEPATASVQASLGGSAAAHFLNWQRSTERAILSYLEAQRRLFALFAGDETAAGTAPPALRPLDKLRKDPRNIVLESPLVSTSSDGEWEVSAVLKVDESHSYFFDHPLDHVPGILILEGMLQLMELFLPDNQFIKALELNFRRFCEKRDRILIQARPIRPARAGAYSVSVVQRGSMVAQCKVETGEIPENLARQAAGHAPVPDLRPFPDPKYLHKLHEENVLVTELQEIVAGESCSCGLLAPPENHILAEGREDSYSLLYLLETTRQCVMLIAHLLERIPLNMPMNLVSVGIQLSRPVPRGVPLQFVCSRQPVRKVGQMTIAHIALDIQAAGESIGRTAIKAQVVDKATYQKQRSQGS